MEGLDKISRGRLSGGGRVSDSGLVDAFQFQSGRLCARIERNPEMLKESDATEYSGDGQ
jgi:hypothetical protein